ncbi:DNA-binding transcriptional regulator YhcF (GntR family) [Catalinimonas alkaloidigena]|uniref:GntR family transcriptional regulator n=1 Tax=Catalinimonas alkaloidigena TaxID=1075417 RepID=UPI00240710FC|nr:GntR family transcriptional regulator [Catalinimonas alkaloidigena]MDF9798713.1 DNA-binding transcriptional regulator YhcF (GntR family) [Catalinimonas alkaloidigena]
MATINFTQIQEDSHTPKYEQVMNLIKSDIENGIFKRGERIPSINETSEDFLISRDTVEKAYTRLREQGIIKSVPGKGYYVNCDHPVDKIRVLLIINKISAHKKKIVQAFVETLGEQASVETCVHNYSTEMLKRLLDESQGNYHYYAIIPCFKDFSEKTVEVISSVPKEKLLLIDKDVKTLKGNYKAVCENFEKDIYDVLASAMDRLSNYQRINFIFPDGNQYVPDIMTGFKKFCTDYHYEYCITNVFDADLVKPRSLYIVIEEDELVNIIKYCKQNQLEIGKDVGIISYNDTPIKEVLHDGIAVISTDFQKMGENAARLLLDKRTEKLSNPFYMIRRPSL